VAKRIRKAAYGKGHHPRLVQYFWHPKMRGVIIADDQRRTYQALKRAYLRQEFVL
jgi:hypothetical protein